MTTHAPRFPFHQRTFWAGFLIGTAVMAAVDEIVFHQLLGWHHFYDRAGGVIGLFSDGLLHAAELIAIIAGFALLADGRRRQRLSRLVVAAGLTCGLGAFQLFDGLVNHKLLQVHQVRYGVELAPYDLAWNAAGAALLALGLILARMAALRSRKVS